MPDLTEMSREKLGGYLQANPDEFPHVYVELERRMQRQEEVFVQTIQDAVVAQQKQNTRLIWATLGLAVAAFIQALAALVQVWPI